PHPPSTPLANSSLSIPHQPISSTPFAPLARPPPPSLRRRPYTPPTPPTLHPPNATDPTPPQRRLRCLEASQPPARRLPQRLLPLPLFPLLSPLVYPNSYI
ncbi:unnamed protein product, partial [Closterium sp. NIES-53]